jgi:hypothetical protein
MPPSIVLSAVLSDLVVLMPPSIEAGDLHRAS